MYRGAAHTQCKIIKKKQIYLPVVAHSLRGSDSHTSLTRSF